MVKTRKVRIDSRAQEQLRNIVGYIKRDSLANAYKVRDDIYKIAYSLLDHPAKFPADKYKINNDGNYRAFEKHHLRVAYRITSTEIRILSIRHTSMAPKEY